MYKLCQEEEHRRTEPPLRRQLLVRNLLLHSLIAPEQPNKEQVWLDACFDELDWIEDDGYYPNHPETMIENNDNDDIQASFEYSSQPPLPPPLSPYSPFITAPTETTEATEATRDDYMNRSQQHHNHLNHHLNFNNHHLNHFNLENLQKFNNNRTNTNNNNTKTSSGGGGGGGGGDHRFVLALPIEYLPPIITGLSDLTFGQKEINPPSPHAHIQRDN
ncbi:hypothetical protein PHYBLDRAFT_152209 [Phycomyces blakesleeanus NRRL 1555(-)]|uniref:Uncharacterized protein n=1 Tax=Phycomyces blakesleeanus (strain ATCC 8743b / DSM 1359 / FGSC 10004 / NBRC 33097 / NRRL 1555) TaxID=763407 RepID=A0A162TF87_PHYB8|nr:hypothetical protein PHYBLDRAFT_152209 [Phycomyces blakesleeanus NRRL 1555(-)]OAD66663.1 hypothetical protein PHYBLDRAFT_152209 [Phycomyces blakesleeanus NRRL 1555(-)]|eukprot:XP_018284703.1 hypothetical protein PHYBLDRAFT_152209 [Phycomyces blakesleeanus NRRL 1555(-)]